MDKIKIPLALIIFFSCMFYYQYISNPYGEKIITVGVFDESNWDVPSPAPNEILRQAIAEFEAENPHVKVKYVSGIPKNEYYEWLSEKIISGDEPDLFIVTSDRFKDFAAMGVMLDLTDLVNGDKEISIKRYYDASVDSIILNNKYYGLPLESVPKLMFVNKTLLMQYGISMPSNNWTWHDFYNICNMVTKDANGDGRPDTYGCYGYNWQQAALTNGVEPISDENKNHYFIDDKVEDAIRFVKAINNLNNGYGVSPRDFDLGKVAFRPFTFAEYRTYQPYPWRIKKYSGFEWDVVKFPAGHYGKNVSTVDTVAMAISSRSKNKTIAWKFLKKISYDKGIQMSIIEKSQGLPVRNDILTSAECQERFDKVMGYGNHMSLSVIDDIMSEAVHANKFRRYWDVMLQADKFIKDIVEGNITVDNSLNQLQKEINIKIEE